MADKPSSIRLLTREQADRLFARVRRDELWYARLAARLRKLHFCLDADTYAAMVATHRAQERLYWLRFALLPAATGGPEGDGVAADWRGDGI